MSATPTDPLPGGTGDDDAVTSRVLVVEDDHGLRNVVARGLREHGFTVVTAVDGASAPAGLGLALARRLARASGGDLVLRESGPGAEFEISLPG
jgi:C4-dicarboxylate-specific signal transduction histidine kinase